MKLYKYVSKETTLGYVAMFLIAIIGIFFTKKYEYMPYAIIPLMGYFITYVGCRTIEIKRRIPKKVFDASNNVWVKIQFVEDGYRPFTMITICDKEDGMGICMDFNYDGRTYASMVAEFNDFVKQEKANGTYK